MQKLRAAYSNIDMHVKTKTPVKYSSSQMDWSIGGKVLVIPFVKLMVIKIVVIARPHLAGG